MSDDFSLHQVTGGGFSQDIHRLSLVQIGISLDPHPSEGMPTRLNVTADYEARLEKALTLTLGDAWSNIVVFPEISIPQGSLANLMTRSLDLMRGRPRETGPCLVCLPLEHLSLTGFKELMKRLKQIPGFSPGDSDVTPENLDQLLLPPCPPLDRDRAFVNMAVLLAIPASGRDGNENGHYFFQSKRYPYPLERTPGTGPFQAVKKTYVLKFGETSVITAICFDLIAQPPGTGLYLSDLIQRIGAAHGPVNYLLLPQCNDKPLDDNFQYALSVIYRRNTEIGQTLRAVGANVTGTTVEHSTKAGGHSWLVTCPFGSDLPRLGVVENRLISFLKDPFSKNKGKEILSLGHYAHRIRLSAPGEWLLNLSCPPTGHLARYKGPDVPLPPHRGSVFTWSDGDWRPVDEGVFSRACRQAERLPGLEVLAELDTWVKDNLGGSQTYSPSYSEFKEGKVFVPEEPRKELRALLKAGDDVWLTGNPASGKTVFSLAMAFEWMEAENGRCLFYDFKDLETEENEFTDAASGDIQWFLEAVPYPLLVLLDNCHTAQKACRKILNKIQEHRLSGQRIQALLLGRRFLEQKTAKNTLLDNALLKRMELRATPEAFLCTARRLAERCGVELRAASRQVEKWVGESGSDLAIFASVFNPSRPQELDRAFIAEMTRQRYLVPAESQGCKEAFLDLCVLSSLELNAEDQTIFGESMEVLFPQFVRDGTVERVPPRQGNPRAYCRLFHPSLATLVLQVKNHYDKGQMRKFFMARALDICQRNPYMLNMIHYRLSTNIYEDFATLSVWCHEINNCIGLIERAVCHAPFWTARTLRDKRLAFSWRRLRELPSSYGHELLLETLVEAPTHFITSFLKFLDSYNLTDERNTLLQALIEKQEFTVRFAKTPSDVITAFLRYIDSCNLTNERNVLLQRLLKNNKFTDKLAMTPVNLITIFLKYLDSWNLAKERNILLQGLLVNQDFMETLTWTTAGNVAIFLKYFDSRKLGDKRENLLHRLLKNQEFMERLAWASPNDLPIFLKYLDSRKMDDKREDLVKKLMINQDFTERLAWASPNDLTTFLKYLDSRKLDDERDDLLQGLLKNQGFTERLAWASPNDLTTFLKYLGSRKLDDERDDLLQGVLINQGFTERLAWASPNDLTTFLKILDSCNLTIERNALLQELLNKTKFSDRLTWAPAGDVTIFLKYLDSCNLTQERKTLLQGLLKSQRFMVTLIKTPAHFITTFLKYLDNCELQQARKDILRVIKENHQFCRTLLSSRNNYVYVLIAYLCRTEHRETAQEIIDLHLNQQEASVSQTRLSSWLSDHLIAFIDVVQRNNITLSDEIWNWLKTKKLVPAVAPDMEFPQDKLLRISPAKLSNHLSRLLERRKLYVMKCLAKGITRDPSLFLDYLDRHSPADQALLRETFLACGLSWPLDEQAPLLEEDPDDDNDA